MQQRSNVPLVLLFAAIAALAVGGWLWFSTVGDGGAAAPLAGEEQVAPEREPVELEAARAPEEERRAVPGTSSEPELSDPEPAEPAPVEAPEPVEEVADLQARTPLAIRVMDSSGFGIEGAEAIVMGTRFPGTSMSYRGEMPEAVTDGQGRAELPVWTWSTRDDRTEGCTLRVEHPDFITFMDYAFPLVEEEQEVTLFRGGSLVVSGWIGDSGTRATELEIELDDSTNLSADDWERLDDGRPVTRRIEPGPHAIRLGHVDAEGRRWFTEVHEFDAPPEAEVTLHLELLPTERLVGEIDPAVPRPILGGVAMLFLVAGATDYETPTLGRAYEESVAADGSFVFEDLPRGTGQWLAHVPGWYSKKTRVETLADAGVKLENPDSADEQAAAWERLGERAWKLPRIQVPQQQTPAVIEMEPGGTLEVTALGPDGEPLPDARLVAWPNYQIQGWGSSIVPGSDWQAPADATGRATLTGLPPESDLTFTVACPGFQLPLTDGQRHARADIASGEVTRVTLELEPR